MIKALKLLGILALISIFFDAFVFPLGGQHFAFIMYLIILPLMISYICAKNINFIKEIIYLYKKTPFKYLMYFVFYMFLTAIILILQGYASPLIYYYILVKFIPATLLIYVLTATLIPKYLNINTFIKIFFILLFFILIWGILGFIADLFGISYLQVIVNFFSNLKQLSEGTEIMLDQVSGLPRARSIFHEPGSLNKMLVIFMPCIYNICLSKNRLYNNKYLNKIIKTFTIPLMWINIILIMSPIFIIFSLLITMCHFVKYIVKFVIKNIYLLVILFTFIVTSIYFIEDLKMFVEISFLHRVIVVLNNLSEIQNIIIKEESLGSRITSFFNSFLLFLKKPFIGYGYDNVRFYIYNQFMQSPLPLTRENIRNISAGIMSNAGVGYNRSLLFGLLPETGIIGTILYYLFLFKNIVYIRKIKPFFDGIELKFLCGIESSVYIIIILSFYIYSFATQYIYLLYGLIASYVIRSYISRKGYVIK